MLARHWNVYRLTTDLLLCHQESQLLRGRNSGLRWRDWARLPHDLLATMSSRIVNEVRGINRVVLDISSKPPATIEWE